MTATINQYHTLPLLSLVPMSSFKRHPLHCRNFLSLWICSTFEGAGCCHHPIRVCEKGTMWLLPHVQSRSWLIHQHLRASRISREGHSAPLGWGSMHKGKAAPCLGQPSSRICCQPPTAGTRLGWVLRCPLVQEIHCQHLGLFSTPLI